MELRLLRAGVDERRDETSAVCDDELKRGSSGAFVVAGC